MAGDIGSEA